jgi:hypothetical protein
MVLGDAYLRMLDVSMCELQTFWIFDFTTPKTKSLRKQAKLNSSEARDCALAGRRIPTKKSMVYLAL